jgi:HTH-type transcriptional regulator, sugar sensing transcriptional regulator
MEQHFDEKTLARLGMFGLTEYEAKVYLTLLVKGAQEASRVSRISGLPRPHTYSVLKSLQMRGLVTVIPEAINLYRAVSLDEGLDVLIDEKEKQFVSLRNAKDQLLSEIKPKESIPSENHAIVQLYNGRQNVYKLIDEMFHRCDSRVDIMTTSHGIVRFYKYFSDMASEFRSKNIAVRFIAPVTPESEEYAKKLSVLVELRRIDDMPPIRFVLVDSKEVLFAEYPEDDYKSTGKETGIWINQEELARMMQTLFDNTWKNTTPYPPSDNE